MALKGDREYNETTDISQFWSTTQTSAERGGVASMYTAGSGISMGVNITDDPNTVVYCADPSGAKPLGVLLQDVNPVMSATRDFPNSQNLEIRPGDKCTLVRKGFVVTDMIPSGVTPTAGAPAYLAASGYISSSQATGAPQVGRFETTKDANGFAKVSINVV